MSLKHLSQKEILDVINVNNQSKENDAMKQHLLTCEECQNKIKDYQLIIEEINKIEVYEPCPEFADIVTANLPDMYSNQEKSLFEILSLIMVFIPISIVLGFILYRIQFKFTFLGKMNELYTSFIHTIYSELDFFQFIHDNIHVFLLFLVCSLVFKIFNWIFISQKIERKSV